MADEPKPVFVGYRQYIVAVNWQSVLVTIAIDWTSETDQTFSVVTPFEGIPSNIFVDEDTFQVIDNPPIDAEIPTVLEDPPTKEMKSYLKWWIYEKDDNTAESEGVPSYADKLVLNMNFLGKELPVDQDGKRETVFEIGVTAPPCPSSRDVTWNRYKVDVRADAFPAGQAWYTYYVEINIETYDEAALKETYMELLRNYYYYDTYHGLPFEWKYADLHPTEAKVENTGESGTWTFSSFLNYKITVSIDEKKDQPSHSSDEIIVSSNSETNPIGEEEYTFEIDTSERTVTKQ